MMSDTDLLQNAPIVQPTDSMLILDDSDMEVIEFLFDVLPKKKLGQMQDLRDLAPNGVVLVEELENRTLLCFTEFALCSGIFGQQPSVLYVYREGDEISVLLSPDGEHQPQTVGALKALVTRIRNTTDWSLPFEAWQNRVSFEDFGYLWHNRQFCRESNAVKTVVGKDGRWSLLVIERDVDGPEPPKAFAYAVDTLDVEHTLMIGFKLKVHVFGYENGKARTLPDFSLAKRVFDTTLLELKSDMLDPSIL